MFGEPLDWNQIGALGEVLGGLGVVVTLLYLALQIRQNTRQMEFNARATRAAAYQQATGLSAEFDMQVIQNPGVARLAFLSPEEVEALDTAEQRRWSIFVATAFRMHQNVFVQYRDDLISPELWRSHDCALRAFIEQPAIRKFWNDNGDTFAESFRDHVNGLL